MFADRRDATSQHDIFNCIYCTVEGTVHVLTKAKLQPLCIHMRWRWRNALCSIKNNDLEKNGVRPFEHGRRTFVNTEVMKQGLIFKISSGLVSGNFTSLKGAHAKRYIKSLAKYLRLAWLWRRVRPPCRRDRGRRR